MTRVSAGSYDLNRWLHGGYEQDIISVIYGPSGSGKTNFCLLAAVSQAKKGIKVVYIDTEGGFSSERVKQIVPEEYEKTLRNILLLKPTTFAEQKDAFEQLRRYLKESVSLIVVDGMTILYRLDFADARLVANGNSDELRNVNAALAGQLRLLAEIARKQNIPVIVTNQVYQWDNAAKMVGGDLLRYWGKCLIELTIDGGKRSAYLRKHRSLPESLLHFQIVEKGIVKRGWL